MHGEEVEGLGKSEVSELYKGKHGQSEKEYQAGRSDAGKRISGDEKHGPASYSRRGVKQQEPTKPGEKPKHTPKLGSAEKSELAYLKSRRAQKEEVQSEERKEVKAPIQEPKEKLKKPSRSDRVAYHPPGPNSARRSYKLEQVERLGKSEVSAEEWKPDPVEKRKKKAADLYRREKIAQSTPAKYKTDKTEDPDKLYKSCLLYTSPSPRDRG